MMANAQCQGFDDDDHDDDDDVVVVVAVDHHHHHHRDLTIIEITIIHSQMILRTLKEPTCLVVIPANYPRITTQRPLRYVYQIPAS